MRRVYVALMSSAAMVTATAAAQPSTGTSADDDVIIVQAARVATPATALPNTVRLIDQDALTEQLLFSTSLIDALGQKVPSFAPSRQKMTGLGESFRGRAPLYLVDGVPQSNPLRDGSRDGFTIDPAVIERIEVLYGANAIQGVGATGGVINYVTLSPSRSDRWEQRYEAGVTLDGNLNGDGASYRTAATVLRDFGDVDFVGGLALEDRGAFYDADDRRIGVDNTQGDIQDSLSTNFFLKLGWTPSETSRLQVMANIFDLDGDGDYVSVNGDRSTGLPTTSVRGEFEGDPAKNEVRTVSVDYSNSALLGGSLSVQAYFQDFESVFGGGVFGTFQDSAIDSTGQLFDQSANNSEKTGLKITYAKDDLPIEGLSVTAGFDALRDLTFQELIQTGRLWVPETEFISYAPFVQLEQQLADNRLRVSGGIRQEIAALSVDDYQTLAFYGAQDVEGGEPDFSETLLNVGISFDAADFLTVYGSYADGFTMPDVGRVLRAVNTPNVDVDTLLDLEPIIADNTEVGATIAHEGFSANLSYFWSASDLGQRLSTNADGIFEVNRERTEIEGFEASLEYAWEKTVIGGSFATLEGRFDSDDDGSVDADLDGANIGPDRLNLFVSASPIENVSLRGQLSHFFDRTFDDTGDATDFEGYTTVDLSAGYDLGEKRGRLDLGIQNAFNEDYIIYYSQTGTTRNDRFFAGRGRTLTIRWSATY